MTTQDILNSVEEHHQILQDLQQELSDTWKEYADALKPIAHRICAKDFEIYETGMMWKDSRCHMNYLFVKIVDYRVEFCQKLVEHWCFNSSRDTKQVTESNFKELFLDFCNEYLKSEEEALEWHKERTKETVVEPPQPMRIIADGPEEPESIWKIFRDFVKYLFDRK